MGGEIVRMWDLCIRPCSVNAANVKGPIVCELPFQYYDNKSTVNPNLVSFMIHDFTTACWRAHTSPASALNNRNPSFSMTTDTWTDGWRRRQTGPAHVLKYTENHWQREWWSTWRGRETFCYATVNWLDKKNVSPLNVSHLRAGVNGTVARQVRCRKRKTDTLNTFPSLSELPRGRQLHFPF